MHHVSMRPVAIAALVLSFGTSASWAQATAPDSAAVPKSDSLTGTPFSTPTSSSGLSATPSAPGAYDLAGIGRRDSAQETILTEPVSGVPIRFENGVFVFPTALVGVGYNDNVIGSSTGAIGSTIFSLQPRVVAELKNRGDRYTLAYTGNFTRFAGSSADNFNNHELIAAGDNYFSARSRLGWSAGYLASTDPRGTTDRTLSAEPDRWNAPVLQGIYAYGAKGAQGRIEVDAGLQSKRYQNNRAFTVGSDVDINSVAGRFFYRVMPRTSMVFEARRIDSNYKLASSTNDNIDGRYLVGVTWEAAAKTSGSFKIGHQNKNFASTSRADASGSTWEGSVKWAPLTYSVVELTTGRTAADSTGVGEYVMNTGTSLSWSHRWASYLSTRATLATVRSDFAGTARADSTRNIGLGVFYQFGRNMRAGLELANSRRNSNQDVFDFKRNTTFVSLEGTL